MSSTEPPFGSLRWKVLLPPVVLVGLLLLLLGLLGHRFIEETARATAELRAQAAARTLAVSPELHLAMTAAADSREGGPAATGQPDRVSRVLERILDGDSQLAYVALVSASGERLALRQDEEGRALAAERRTLGAIHEQIHGVVLRRVGGRRLVIAPQPSASGDRAPLAVFVAASVDREGAEGRAGLLLLIVVGVLGLLGYTLMTLQLVGGLTHRLRQLFQGVRRVGEGDLSSRVGAPATDEIGEIGRAFDEAAERIGRVVGQLQNALQSLEHTSREAAEATAGVQRGVLAQLADTDEALRSVRDIVQTLGTAVKQSDSIRDEVRLSANIVQRLATLSQESASGVEEAERVLGASDGGVQQVAQVLSDMARQAGLLGEEAQATANAMLDVKHSIGRVREVARTAAALAEDASIDAERGGLILQGSLAGIEHIREASRAISAVTDDLQRRVGEIGDVLHLITELTQRTNLLALNASIIAAQAGAEGRGFAVVADEIKDLARRTANSAGSIDTLIQALAEGAQAARRAAIAGGEAVEAGAAQARDAARTMADILTRLRDWAQMARSIAAATDDQARSANQVTRSIQEVQAHAGDISARAVDQARRGELLQRQGTRLQEVMATLSASAQEQREGTAQVADTLVRLVHVVDEMSGAERSRVTESERVRSTLEMMRRVVTGQRDAVAALERVSASLLAQVAALRVELSRLRA